MKSTEVGFTYKELEVLACMREGLSNIGIAERLRMSENTVKAHINRIYSKIGINEKDPKTNSRVTMLNRVAQRSAELTVTHIVLEGTYGDGMKFRKVTPVNIKLSPDESLYADFDFDFSVEKPRGGKGSGNGNGNGNGASERRVKCM